MIRLFHYTKLQFALTAVRDRRLKISMFDRLNDPFDFLGIATETQNQKKQIELQKRELAKGFGIICLSQTWKAPLLWGHYADAHQGACLGFEVLPGHYKKINYVKERPKLKNFGKKSVAKLTLEDRENIAFNKFLEWNYEKEWRRIVPLIDSDFVDGNYYQDFDEHMVLQMILFGSKAEISESRIKQIIKANPQIKIAFTTPHSTKFEIEIDEERTLRLVPEENRVMAIFIPSSPTFDDVLGSVVAGWINQRPAVRDAIMKFADAIETLSNRPANTTIEKSEKNQKITE